MSKQQNGRVTFFKKNVSWFLISKIYNHTFLNGSLTIPYWEQVQEILLVTTKHDFDL